jgi:hypothetical protein
MSKLYEPFKVIKESYVVNRNGMMQPRGEIHCETERDADDVAKALQLYDNCASVSRWIKTWLPELDKLVEQKDKQ